MLLKQLAREPQLIKITLDDADTIKEYGEPVEFWTWDRQDMATFVRLATIKPDNLGDLIKAVNDLVLDEEGKPILGERVVPTALMSKIITRVVEILGK